MRHPTFAPLAFAAGLAASALPLLLWATLLAAPAAAKVFLTPEEALALAFPGCAIERQTVYLTVAEVAATRDLAGTDLASAVVHPYRARRLDGGAGASEAKAGGEACGTAYFETHRVRTLAETVMVAIDPAGGVLRIEVLSFDEPPDYLPRIEWYAQFGGRRLAPETELGRAIRPVTGATLTARATTDAARRALAVHALIAERSAAQPSTPPSAPAP
jgi:hypothetical protein